jgi:hypothetical protein
VVRMDRHQIAEHFALAELHVAQGEDTIARQQQLIAELNRHGHDTRLATELLTTFEQTQNAHLLDRERLRAEFSKSIAGPTETLAG